MIQRLIELLDRRLAVGGSAALALGASPLQVIGGAGTGAMFWMALDHYRLGRYRDWLRRGQTSGAPNLPDDWAELVERSQKGLQAAAMARLPDAQVEERQRCTMVGRLPGLAQRRAGARQLRAHRAVQPAVAEHLGFDAERDLGQYLSNLVRDPVFVAYLRGGDHRADRDPDPCHAAGTAAPHFLQFHPTGPATGCC